MSQERWDVVIRFLNGPRQFEADLVLRGPVIRLGSNPGPNGVRLDGYRALDDRHAVISAYQGGTAQIAPVGPNQVRVAPHENVDWESVQAIRGPVFLSDGCAVHLGPPGRGCTFTFVECRRLGVWQQQALLSEAADGGGTREKGESQVRQLDVGRRMPWWFLPGLALMVFSTLGMVGLVVLVVIQNQPEPLGPTQEGKDYYEYGDVFDIKIDKRMQAATGDGIKDFVGRPNKALSGVATDEDLTHADPALLDATTRNEQRFVRSWAYWAKLEEVKEKYAMVLGKLRGAGLPDVLAGVPFRESQYFEEAKDPILCAFGMWQFQPEIAFRNGLTVKGCHNGGNPDWEPHAKALPIGALQHAEYVLNGSCTITRCDQDERGDPKRATDAAVNNFLVPWKDDDFKRSGAAVQLVIATHNAGYDDSPYRDGKESRTNIRVAYRRYLKQSGKTRAPDFIGVNLTCNKPGQIDEHDNVASSFNDSCGSYLPSVTQVYVPYVIAAHLVAVCYYGTNYGTDPDYPEFKPYQAYASGYCKEIKVPTPDDVRQHPVSK